MITWQAKLLNGYLRTLVKPRLRYYANLLEQGNTLQAVKKFRRLFTLAPKPPKTAVIQREKLACIDCLWVKSRQHKPRITILYLHGGGYVAGSAECYANLGYHLATATQAQVIIPNYRLAPEHLFPAAVEDAMAVCLKIYQKGISPDNLIIAGDSAGGGLALATLLSLRDANQPLPAAGILLSPWVDLALTGRSLSSNATADPILVKPPYVLYLGGRNPNHPLASPLYADLSGLPSLQILVGSTEILLDDAQRLADKAREHEVKVNLEIWQEMPHVWLLFADFLPEAKQALQGIAKFIESLN